MRTQKQWGRGPRPPLWRPPRIPLPSAERTLDLALGSVLLLLASPLLAAAALALAVRGRRVTRRSTRTGLHGAPFVLRSLDTRWLKLDVVSRLHHVVRGELSLVGPAPLAPGDARNGTGGARHWRQELKPGLTGLAQVRHRSTMPWDEADLLDQHYAEHRGLRLDLAVLAEAVRVPLREAAHTLPWPGKARLSDTDHRLPGYSTAE
ncbi:sugar transferase [Streptomyces drozdowiczii]|uniref:Sugar transferase n=1 Tax=Streptomyces drozdowiczii TaxID=202862 RepID=A0ABY6PTT4_9ACTN|nr:sugar transferase [Streptomyces drozdowiczii]MCX0244707.1 sugar transferase [Streptomyces drozdowiczii]UZK55556.1 sugar transferase [Streptomyces drozdowiczii]